MGTASWVTGTQVTVLSFRRRVAAPSLGICQPWRDSYREEGERRRFPSAFVAERSEVMRHRFILVPARATAAALRFAGLGLVVFAFSSVAQATVTPAPEIDAGSFVSGLTLLAGGILIVTNRVRRK
jgi:hypothetical protein